MATKGDRQLFKYSVEAMEKALLAIREKGMAVATACKEFGVPRTSVRNRLSGKTSDNCRKVGPSSVLGEEIEEKIVRWILDLAKRGFPINREGLYYSVQKIVGECNINTNFVNNTPSRKWYEGFMKRHPEISQKKAEFINRARASVSENNIKQWFEETRMLLGEDVEVLNHPNRIFNMDETAMFLSPKGELVLGPKGKGIYDVGASDKDNVTTLITISAEGQIVTPLTIFKFQRLPKIYATSAPSHWAVGHSDTGWMQSKQFFEYFANIFVKYLDTNEVPRPIVVFLDGHSSHLSINLSNLCRDNKIILICLPPNTTHILQPLDVAFFFPLKQAWKKFTRKWRFDHEGKSIQKKDIPTALNAILKEEKFQKSAVAGFRRCGLFPFDENAVDYGKCLLKTSSSTSLNTNNITQQEMNISETIANVEKKIESHILEQFHATYSLKQPWNGQEKYLALFDLWRSLKYDSDNLEDATMNQLENDPDLLIFDFPELHENPTPAINILQNIVLTSSEEQIGFSTLSLSPSSHETENLDNTEFGGDTQEDKYLDLINGNLKLDSNLTVPEEKKVDVNVNVVSEQTEMDSCSHNDIRNNITSCNNEIDSTDKEWHENVKLLKKKSVSEVLNEVITWPENKDKSIDNTTTKRIKRKLPSVITSDKWIELMDAKENDKKKPKKTKQTKLKNESKGSCDVEYKKTENLVNSKTDTNQRIQNNEVDEKIISVGCYVIVRYDKNYYPAKVVNKERDQFYCCAMHKSGRDHWKWPDRNDLVWYNADDVISKIKEPVSINMRGAYDVPEMREFDF